MGTLRRKMYVTSTAAVLVVLLALAPAGRALAGPCGVGGTLQEKIMQDVIVDLIIKPALARAGKPNLGRYSAKATGLAVALMLRSRDVTTWPSWAHKMVRRSAWFGENVLHHLGLIIDVTTLAYKYSQGQDVRGDAALFASSQVFTALWPQLASELGLTATGATLAAQGALIWGVALVYYKSGHHYATQIQLSRYYECHDYLRRFVALHEVPNFLTRSKQEIVRHFTGRMMALDKAYLFAMDCYLKLRPERERFELPPTDIHFWSMHRQVDFNIKMQTDPSFRRKVEDAVQRLYRTFGLFRAKILLERVRAKPQMQVALAVDQYLGRRDMTAEVCAEYRRRVGQDSPGPSSQYLYNGKCVGPVVAASLCPDEFGIPNTGGNKRCEYQFIPCANGGFKIIKCPGCPQVGIVRK